MSVRSTLTLWFPLDDSHAPFGLSWLRGLTLLPLLLVGLAALSVIAQRVGFSLLSRRVLAVELWLELAAWALMTLLFVPMLAAIVAALTGSAARSAAANACRVAGAVLLGALLVGELLPTLECQLHAVASVPYGCENGGWSGYRLSLAITSALWGLLLAALLHALHRQQYGERALRESRLQRLQAERQEVETRLMALQSQIEPHFLFNTLAHIQHLQGVDAERGRSMLGSLAEYVRLALPQMRAPDAALAHELALVQAYVQVQQVRMGERLRASFDVPADLLKASVPPMMVLTLAENAIKHGLGPQRNGGALRIAARRLADGRLEVEVLDDGVGLRAGAGGGIGLANTRARLLTHFGDAAALEIGNHPPNGVRAAIVLPLEIVE